MVYDGFRWESFELPNKTIIRSVKTVGDTIYIGTYEDFGFYIKDEKGTLQYTSIADRLPEASLKNLEFWQIDKVQENIYFRSFSKIYYLRDTQLEELKTPNDIFISSYVLNNCYIIGTLNSGLYSVNPTTDKVENLEKASTFNNAAISALSQIEGHLLVGTDKGQLFIQDGANFKIWNRPLNEDIEKYKINKLTNSGKGKIAIGTILNGVYISDYDGNVLYNINKNNNLQNNTVLAQVFDMQGNLWLGLDNGIDLIDFNSPVEFFTDPTGFLGSVYALCYDTDRLLLGSNKGVYTLENESLKLIDDSQGHVWDIFKRL